MGTEKNEINTQLTLVKENRMKRLKVGLIIVIVLVIVSVLYFVEKEYKNTGETPREAVIKMWKDKNPVVQVKQLVSIEGIDSKRNLVFYINSNDDITLDLVKKTWIGRWRVKTGGGKGVEPRQAPHADYHITVDQFNHVGGELELRWGLIYNDEIVRVIFSDLDENAVYDLDIIKMGDIRLWYIIDGSQDRFRIKALNRYEEIIEEANFDKPLPL